jgi:hypothetical protein
VPGPARIDQSDLESLFPPQHVGSVFCDDRSGRPGPRLANACLVASRRAESLLLRAWSLAQIDVLYAEDEAVKMFTAQLAMAYGVAGRPEWSGQGSPYATLEQSALKALKDLADAEVRSRAETQGAGQNPRVSGSMTSPSQPQYVFTRDRCSPKRGGY